MSGEVRKTWLSIIVLFFCLSYPCLADNIYYYVDEEGVWHFTNIKTSPRYRLYLRSFHKKAAQYIKDYSEIIEKAAKRYSIEPALIKAIIKAESNFDRTAVSCDGAKGLMQLMPSTAKQMNVSDPLDPEENIFGGVRYLRILLNEFKDIYLAIAAYNAGPSAVRYYHGVPPFPETRRFLKMVLKFYREYKSRHRR